MLLHLDRDLLSNGMILELMIRNGLMLFVISLILVKEMEFGTDLDIMRILAQVCKNFSLERLLMISMEMVIGIRM